MQIDHILGLMERFSRITDNLLLFADSCPNSIYRKIAHYGAHTRARANWIMEEQKLLDKLLGKIDDIRH